MIQATLLLEGGGARGIFTSGVLDCLIEKDCMLSDVIGLSAGASNALEYVAKQKGWSRDCLIHKDGSTVRYCNIKKSFRSKSLLDMDMMFDQWPNETVPLDYETYFKSDINSMIGITNCITGEVEYHTESHDKERLMQLCRASCSLPLLSSIVKIDDVPYIDGGIVDSVPIQYAQSLGNEKIIVVLTRNAGYRKGELSERSRRLFERAYKQYPNLIHALNSRFERYNTNMDYLEALEKMGRVFVIRPKVELCKRMESNPEKLTELYEHGKCQMYQEYDNLQRYLERR